MPFNSLQEIFSAFNQLKVLVIGDVMIDSYVWGKVSRVSPEAPVPIVHVHKKERRLGGAANVALNLQSLGAKPILCTVVGDDPDGESFFQLLEQQGITNEALIKSSDRITTVKERVLAGYQHLLRVDSESIKPLTAAEEKSLSEKIAALINEVDAVIFEDYDKGAINEYIISKTVALASENDIPVIVDPKKDNFFHYKSVDLFKPNLKELKEGTKLDFDKSDKKALQGAVKSLRESLGATNVMTTLSEEGVYIENEEETFHIKAHARSISDVSGAGDTVVSIAGLCRALKLNIKFTASLANLGGGLVCEHLGVVSINKQQLLEEAQKHKLLE